MMLKKWKAELSKSGKFFQLSQLVNLMYLAVLVIDDR